MHTDPVNHVLELLADGQAAEALEQLDALVREEPYHGGYHALRALVQRDLGRTDEASLGIRTALELSPDNPFVHFAAGAVALEQGAPLETVGHAQAARRLAPDYLEAALLEARARASLGQWDQALRLTTVILEQDPDNEDAAVLERVALDARKDGELTPAAWRALAERFPLNPLARTGSGWTSLTAGRVRVARREFEQALALDPSASWAREGLVLALKARNPAYALLLRFVLWFQRLPRGTRVLVLIGGVFGYRLLRTAAQAQPALRPLFVPLLVAYGLFVVFSWLADPLLNLLLMARGETRRLLPADQQRGALLVAGCLGLAALLGAAAATTPWSAAGLSALGVGFTSFTVSGAYAAQGTKRRRLQWIAAVAFGLSLVAGVAPASLANLCFGTAMLGVVVSTWMSALARDEPAAAR